MATSWAEKLANSPRVEKMLTGLMRLGGQQCAQLLQGALQSFTDHDLQSCSKQADLAQDMAWEKLHTGAWKDVPQVWRDAYAFAGLLLSGPASKKPPSPSSKKQELIVALRVLDMAVLMGGPTWRPEIDSLISSLQAELASQAGTKQLGDLEASQPVELTCLNDCPSPKRRKLGDLAISRPVAGGVTLPPGAGQGGSIERREVPPLEAFLCNHMLAEKPAVITGVVCHWPAFSRWKDTQYLRRVAGARTVPVEVGKDYLAEGWKQELMTLSAFIEEHLEDYNQGHSSRGYLAQHPLFEQIPELERDIVTPEYCSLGGGEMQSVNAWFGPAGTVTPLHHDPHYNLLAQVVGEKYVRLYSPKDSAALYPHSEGMLSNSSQVDLDEPDATRFPDFDKAPYLDCILHAGEMLYIPPLWWHYVKALTKSFSVSFWWAKGAEPTIP